MFVLIIDNYDSFTFNLYQYIGEILMSRPFSEESSAKVVVRRNDEITINDIKQLAPDRIIISPGAGTPEDKRYFGVCSETIVQLGANIPVLGVCLGMQGIAHCFGGKVIHAPIPMHGKVSTIQHNNQGVFSGLPQGMEVMRYHSLMVEAVSLPECFEISSIVSDTPVEKGNFGHESMNGHEIMGIQHRQFPIEGVQFHPESFATEGAKTLLSNFLLQA